MALRGTLGTRHRGTPRGSLGGTTGILQGQVRTAPHRGSPVPGRYTIRHVMDAPYRHLSELGAFQVRLLSGRAGRPARSDYHARVHTQRARRRTDAPTRARGLKCMSARALTLATRPRAGSRHPMGLGGLCVIGREGAKTCAARCAVRQRQRQPSACRRWCCCRTRPRPAGLGTHTRARAHTHRHTRAHTHAHTHTHTHTPTRTHTHTRTHARTHVHTRTRTRMLPEFLAYAHGGSRRASTVGLGCRASAVQASAVRASAVRTSAVGPVPSGQCRRGGVRIGLFM